MTSQIAELLVAVMDDSRDLTHHYKEGRIEAAKECEVRLEKNIDLLSKIYPPFASFPAAYRAFKDKR